MIRSCDWLYKTKVIIVCDSLCRKQISSVYFLSFLQQTTHKACLNGLAVLEVLMILLDVYNSFVMMQSLKIIVNLSYIIIALMKIRAYGSKALQ